MNFIKKHGTLLALTASLAILLVELLLPLSWDNWVYHIGGWDLVTFGKWPYVGTWTFNFPGMIYLDAVATTIFGASDLGFRVFDVIFQLVTCYLLVIAARRYLTGAALLLTPIVYCLIYTSFAWSAAGQVDAFVAGFLLGGLLLIRNAFDSVLQFKKRKIPSLIFGAALVAFCAILRPTYLLFPAGLLILVAFNKYRKRLLPFIFLGSLAGVILPLTPYLFFQGGLYAFYTQAFRYGLDVYGMMPRSPMELWASQRTTIEIVSLYLFLTIVTGIALHRNRAGLRRTQTTRFDLILYFILIISCCISILVMRKYLVSHFLPLVALLSPVIASGIVSPLRLTKKRPVAIAISALLFLFFAYRLYPRNIARHFIKGINSPLGALEYCYNEQDRDSLCGYLAERDAAAYLNKIDSNKERVEVLSCYRSYLHTLCTVNDITKYTRIEALAIPQPNGFFTTYQQEWRRDYLNTLRLHPPPIIVESDNGFRMGLTDGPLAAAEKIPGFRDFFEQYYTRDTAIHGFTFYLARQ